MISPRFGILVRQGVRDLGDVVEKFTGAPRVPGVTPRSGVVIVGVGAPSRSADFRGGLCYLDAVEPEPTRSRPEVVPFRVDRRTEHLRSFSRSRREHHAMSASGRHWCRG